MYQMGLIIERARLIYWVKTNVLLPMISVRPQRATVGVKDRWWRVEFKDHTYKWYKMNGRIAVEGPGP